MFHKLNYNLIILIICSVFSSTVTCNPTKKEEQSRDKRTVGFFLGALANFLNVQDYQETTPVYFTSTTPSPRRTTKPPPPKWPPLDYDILPWVLQAKPPSTTPAPLVTPPNPYTTEEPLPYHAQIIIIPLHGKEKHIQNGLHKETEQYYRPNTGNQLADQGQRFQLGIFPYDQRNSKQILHNQEQSGPSYNEQQHYYNTPNTVQNPYGIQKQNVEQYTHNTIPTYLPQPTQIPANQLDNYNSRYNQQVEGYVYNEPTVKPSKLQKYDTLSQITTVEKSKNVNETTEQILKDSILKHKDADVIFRLGYLYGKAQKGTGPKMGGNDFSNDKYDNFRAYIEQEPKVNSPPLSRTKEAERNKRLKKVNSRKNKDDEGKSIHVEIVKSVEPEEKKIGSEARGALKPEYSKSTTTESTFEMVKSYELPFPGDQSNYNEFDYNPNQGSNFSDQNVRIDFSNNFKVEQFSPVEQEYSVARKNFSNSEYNNVPPQLQRDQQGYLNSERIQLNQNIAVPDLANPFGNSERFNYDPTPRNVGQFSNFPPLNQPNVLNKPLESHNRYLNFNNPYYSVQKAQELTIPNQTPDKPQGFTEGTYFEKGPVYPQDNLETQVSFFYPEEDSLKKPEKQGRFPNPNDFTFQPNSGVYYPPEFQNQLGQFSHENRPFRTNPLRPPDSLLDQISHDNFQRKIDPPPVFDQDTGGTRKVSTCHPVPFTPAPCFGGKSRRVTQN